MNRLDFQMFQLRRLTEREFKLCFSEPMTDVTDVAEPAADIWSYVERMDLGELALNSLGDARYVYRDGRGRYDQVLIETDRADAFVAIIVDLSERAVFGHFLLDLGEQYGARASRQD